MSASNATGNTIPIKAASKRKRVSFPAVVKNWCPTCKKANVMPVKEFVKRSLASCPVCGGPTVPFRRGRKNRPQTPKPPAQKATRSVSRRAPMRATRSSQRSLTRAVMNAGSALNAAPMRASGVLTAERRLLMSMLNPQASMGSKPVKMKSDNMQLPRVAYKFDSVFTVINEGILNEFKIMFHPAPTIIATLWAEDIAAVRVLGTKSVTDGNYLHILGSKIAQLGTVNDRFEFEPAEDWTKYRCIGYSAQSMWVGREIDKSGTVYIARQNEELLPLEDFNPTLKQDSIYSQAYKTISVTGQHRKPVYEFQYTESADSVEDSNEIHEREIRVPMPMSYDSEGGYTGFQTRTVGSTSTLTYIQWLSYDATSKTCKTPDSISTFVKFLTEFQAAYDAIQVRTNGNLTIDCSIDYFFQIDRLPGGGPVISTTGRMDLDVTSPNMTQLAIDIWARLMLVMNVGAFQDVPLLGTLLKPTADITFIVRVPKNFKRTQSNIFTRNIAAAIRADELDGLFTDASFAQPVMHFTLPASNYGAAAAFQFVHTTNYELVVDDASALGNFALAEKDTNVTTINVAGNTPIQGVLQSLPPAVIFDGGQIDSTAKTELASRGILSSICGILGPVASAIFPEVAPLVAPITGLAHSLDTALKL